MRKANYKLCSQGLQTRLDDCTYPHSKVDDKTCHHLKVPSVFVCSSEQIGLFHDAQKFLLVHLSIPISVSFVNHFLQFLISHPLAQFFSNSLQIFERNFASFVIVEQAEGLQNLVFGWFKAQGSHGNLQLL